MKIAYKSIGILPGAIVGLLLFLVIILYPNVMIHMNIVSTQADSVILLKTIDPTVLRPVALLAGVRPVYGELPVRSLGCTICFSDDRAGGVRPNPGVQPAPVLFSGEELGKWTELVFINPVGTSANPGKPWLPAFVAWKHLAHMNDDDFTAVWSYLKSVPVNRQ